MTKSTKTAPSDAAPAARDWSDTLFLPKTDFSMRAGLQQLEPRLLERWSQIKLYDQLRAASKGRPKFVLHDGPPYANGNIHIGHALNKILKDLVTRSQQMLGCDSNYVPGWDCHGLPIEWQVEQEYRAKGLNKDDVPKAEFRAECRAFAQRWIDIQRAEFKRLGVEGDWAHPYSTMDFKAEATIAAELMKFAMNGSLYRGSKPVMWSVVEKTALAEAEIEYHDYQSDTIYVTFPIQKPAFVAGHRTAGAASPVNATIMTPLAAAALAGPVSIVIWTTTPWTIPGNRAISYNHKIGYGLYEVTAAPDDNWAKTGDKLVLADTLAAAVMKAAKVEAFERRFTVAGDDLAALTCAHPLAGHGYDFPVPLLDGDHVTDDTGTGFVHTAPGHGTDDFQIWMANGQQLARRGIDTTIPMTVDGDGFLTQDAPGFQGKRVIDDKGNKGDANQAVIEALTQAHRLVARGRLKHQYPHSWRSKKPVIYRNTPQWFVAMDKPLLSVTIPYPSNAAPDPNPLPVKTARGSNAQTLRQIALGAIRETQWVPAAGENRITGMITAKPDWVLSRQRAWGVPITVFVHKDSSEVIPGPGFAGSAQLMARITTAMETLGADAWFEDGAAHRFLDGLVDDPTRWEPVTDILDVWFDSGSTHAYTLEDAVNFPGLADIQRKVDGGRDTVMYLEGSDQHRGWFHSSLLESSGTRGRAPFDVVLTHGFILDDQGHKMSKSSKNGVSPQEVIKQSGADILRLWVASSDYTGDITLGPEMLKTVVENYRKIRNSIRWMLGTLAHYEPARAVAAPDMPELERFMLHRLAELDGVIRKAYIEYDYKKVVAALAHFMNTDLSAFYFDIRKDTLYCEPPSSPKRLASLSAIEQIFRCVTVWLAPILAFTAEEAWLSRYAHATSVHLEIFPEIASSWRDEPLAQKWEQVRRVRGVVTGALEIDRANKRIGSSLEAAAAVFVDDNEVLRALDGIDLAEITITSVASVHEGVAPEAAFTAPDMRGVGVVTTKAPGQKCARSWRFTTDVGSDPQFPELSARDARAVRALGIAP